MAILQAQQVFWDAYNLTSKTNALTMEYGCEALDDTVLGNAYRSNAAGLIKTTAQVEGFVTLGATYEAALKSNIGVVDVPFSVTSTSTEGATAWFFKMMQGDYKPYKSAVGELHSFSAGGMGTGPLIRGTLIGNKSGISATANGTGFQLGAVSATKKLYAAIHVLGASGTTPTLDMIIQRDDNSGFTSAVTAATFTQMTAIGSQWQEVAGAITDDYFRIRYTIGGTTPSFDFVVVAGIR